MFFRAFAKLARAVVPARPPEPEVFRDLGKIESFPTLSDTAVRVIALSHDPDSTIAGMAHAVRRDGVVAAAVLKAANSALYRGRYQVEDVLDAVVRLGLRGCTNVVTAFCMKGHYKHPTPDGQAACDGLLRHALFTANVAARANALLDLGFKGEEFTAGLLHDIGRVILCVRSPAGFAEADPMTFDEDGTVLAREQEAVGFDHCEVGVRFARANKLPESIAAAILNHHFPAADGEHRRLTALVALADRLANHVQRTHALKGYGFDACPGFRVLRAGLRPPAADELKTALPGAVVQALRATRHMLRLTAG
ncbi:MAG: HDOD domain-containing protein [Gemmataceae bacterium]|nr:HDOD domain-containing protein [Gemmataceae bacterium]